MAYSRDELISRARELDAAGDKESARRLVEIVRRQSAEDTTTTEAVAPVEATTSSSALDTFSDFGRGISGGVMKVAEAGQDLVHRTIGTAAESIGQPDMYPDEDILARLNRRQEERVATNTQFKDRSPYAFGAGEMLGETLAVAPIGGFAGVGAKALLKEGTKRATALGLAAEGAATGAFMTEGGVEDRLSGAAVGAAADLTMGAAFNALSGKAATIWRNFKNKGKVADRISEMTTEVAQRVDDAAVNGGYTMDGAVASQSPEALDTLQRVRLHPETRLDYNNFKAQQEVDVTSRARSTVEEFGALDNLDSPSRNIDQTVAALSSARKADFDESEAAYKLFDKAATESGYTPDKSIMDSGLADLMDEYSPDIGPVSTRKLGKDIKDELGRYGILTDGEATKPLTFSNYEDLIQDINGLGNWSTMNNGEKALLGKVKSALEDSLDTAMKLNGADASVVALGRQARDLRSGYHKNYTSGDIVDLLTKDFKGVTKDHGTMMSKLKAEDIVKVKARLVTSDPAAYRNLQQAPLLKALAAATKDTSESIHAGADGFIPHFNDNAFWREIDKMDKTAQETLWGKEFVANLGKTKEAWRARTRVPSTSGALSKSGTGDSLGVQAGRSSRFLQSGKLRNIGMMLSSIYPALKSAFNKPAEVKAFNEMLDGEIPSAQLNTLRKSLLDDLDKSAGADAHQSKEALRALFRMMGVSSTVDNDDKDSLKQ